MNQMRNKVQLIGHLGQAPEIKTIADGKKVAHLNVATNENYKNAKGENTTIAQNKEGGADTKSETRSDEKGVSAELLTQGKEAIENAIKEGKLSNVYAHLARAQPEAFLREIADQAHGILSTGEKPVGEELAGEDADLAAREQYGYEIVDVAKKMYPKETPAARPTTVIRHGESEANARKVASTDETPLTPKGEKQAEELGKKLTTEGYANVLPSDTTRTKQTAEKVVEQTGGEIVKNPELSKLLKEWARKIIFLPIIDCIPRITPPCLWAIYWHLRTLWEK